MTMHITSVEMTDFRSHEHLTLSFVDGVNALIGPSNTGKTNVMRAIRWCLTNQPNGTDVIRFGAKEATVTVHLSNGYSIERKRGRSSSNNFYRLYKDGEMVGEYTGFGQKVPSEIARAHGMSLNRESSMNFHDQLETAFLVASSPSERANYIGNLEELAKVDRAASGLNEELRDRSKEVKRIEQDIGALEIEIGRLRNSVSAKQSTRESLKMMLEALREEESLRSTLEGTLANLHEIRSRLDEAHHVMDTFRRAAEGFPDGFDPQGVNRLFALAQEAKVTRERLDLIKDDASIDLETIKEYHLLVEGALLNAERIATISNRIEENARERLAHLPYLSDEVRRVVDHDFGVIGQEIEAHRLLFRHHANLVQTRERQSELTELTKGLMEENQNLLDEMLGLLVEAGRCTTCGQDTTELTHACVEQTI